MRRRWYSVAGSGVVLGLLLVACGDAELAIAPASGAGGMTTGGGVADGGSSSSLMTVGVTQGGQGGTGGDPNPCANVTCDSDQHCEIVDDVPTCVLNDCAELNCGATEECQEGPNGGGMCVDISCDEDVECPEDRWCDTAQGICVDDECTALDRECQGADLYECTSNGSALEYRYTCGSPAYFQSDCIDDGNGNAFCGCEDDWDCPAYTQCEANLCTGTGNPPTCFLPPEPFTNVLPQPEIVWGGQQGATSAVGSPFPASAQVVQSPIVANLDDDNGDGLINDLDFPEIIFTTYCGSDFTSNGILRAIHGGGPTKGQDFFASCDTTVWHEGDDPNAVTCACSSAILDSTASLAVGDLDYDGVPEIVAIHETSNRVVIYSNTGELIHTTTINGEGNNPGPAIANLDNDGFAEIIVGRQVYTLDHDANNALIIVDRFQGNLNQGSNGQGPVSCISDLDGDNRPEIIAGTTAYRYPQAPAGVTATADCTGAEVDPDEVAWCAGNLVPLWDAAQIPSNGIPTSNDDGFCAVADVLGVDPAAAPGPNNPLDGNPEVIVIANGRIYILGGADGIKHRDISPGAGNNGGPPNVDDFDGDGFPEFATAYGSAYTVFDLQDPTAECPAWPNTPPNDGVTVASVNSPRTPPNVVCTSDADCANVAAGTVCNEQTQQCICLHNGWKRATEDDSSRVTGSSVFDFNGDGAAEVIYNDECRFRLYDGLNGDVYFSEPSESRTRIEYPIVADVDNDGNAEIVFATTNESGFCSENNDPQYNNGLEVWGDAGDFWVAARRIWSQHPYNVTNTTEDGKVPLIQPEHWRTYNGRSYNIFRSNPRTLGIAPDLTVAGMQFSSPDATCGQLSENLDIVLEIRNQGDLRVGPGVVVGLLGDWINPAVSEPLYADNVGTPLTFTLQSSLEPGQSIFISLAYDANNNSPGVLPDSITAIVDSTMIERECDETNNELTEAVEAGDVQADLRIQLGTPGSVPCPTVPTTVFNDGSADADNVVVRYFAGDPNQGGAVVHEQTLPQPVPAGGSFSFNANLSQSFPQGLLITIFGVVDPDNAIPECNDGNNSDAADAKIQCGGVN